MSTSATEARDRLDHLLALRADDRLEPTAPAPLAIGSDPEWSVGWVDKALEVAITVVFIADPVARDEAANSLRAGAEQDDQSVVLVGTNGGMLFYGRTSADDHDGNRVSRLRELAGRFGGTERDG